MKNFEPFQGKVFGVIDAQRGFMPAKEGERLGLGGFGELPITNGEKIVPLVNQLLATAALNQMGIFTTQDSHPPVTAHFEKDGGMWPVHCVAFTDGELLHPAIELPDTTQRFVKGDQVLKPGDEDQSYSGYWAHKTGVMGVTLPDWLNLRETETIYLAGLAFDYCVAATALDLKRLGKFEVAVIEDATRPVADDTAAAKRLEMANAGIRIIDAKTALGEWS